MPIGKRPRPAVAKPSKSPRYDTSSGSYSGNRGSKSPTGSRPTPSVAKNSPSPHGGKPGAGAMKPKVTSMPAPKQKWASRGGGKPHGGN